MEVKLGDRVENDGFRGTIKWIGEVPNVNGVWYGIDWDDENRGKHNGTHDGIKYFSTRYEKSGSFVRPPKVSLGISFEEAVRGRYQDDVNIEEVLTSQLRRNIKARFVEVVGMEKVGKKQSQLDALQTVVLDGWSVRNGGDSDLGALLPRLQDLDLSNTLMSSWSDVACITKQLPSLKFINVSGNELQIPSNPHELVASTQHITHVVMNKMLTYSWKELMLCSQMFPHIKKIQLAYNNLKSLGPIPPGVFEYLADIDLGVNPISDWTEICHLGMLPKLEIMNLNNCSLSIIQFSETPAGEKTDFFQSLNSLMVADNPLSVWESVGELDKLKSLEELVLSYKDFSGRGNYALEYTFGRIRNLKMLNRTHVNPREKRDYQLFYLRSFSGEYFSNGGTENPDEAKLSEEFIRKHPSYLSIAKMHGVAVDERSHENQKSQKLKDLKLELRIVPHSDNYTECLKSFLPSTRISKIRMMIKRLFKLDGTLKVRLVYCPVKESQDFKINLDNDMHDLQFYSMASGDVIHVYW